jgi:hypothetical protein
MTARGTLARAALVALTGLALWLTVTRLRISSDLSLLFPTEREAAALARFAHVFGGGDLGVVLLRGASADEVELASRAIVVGLRTKSSIVRVLDRAPDFKVSDPMSAWTHAGPTARRALARALTPEGMRERLDGTRTLLLAPGSEAAEEWLAKDPLRLALIPWESKRELAAGVVAGSDGMFRADAGRARLVIVEPKGGAFDADAASRFVKDFEDARDATRASDPSVTIELTGGHAIADATAAMLKRDLALSGTLSLVLSSVMFVATFRRARAILAVLPPLVLGTLWTTGIAALAPAGLSALAIAFTAVVVGVGVDTGVHVYAALLVARRAGLPPGEAADFARRTTWRPTLLAAVAAGLAFGSLALSDLSALKQLGILCGLGEVLTAVAILLVTPEIGALLERGPPPDRHTPRWHRVVARLTGTRRRAAGALAMVGFAAVLAFAIGWPRAGDALVAIRPRALGPLATQETIYKLFGGRPGQWIVLSSDPDRERAQARSDSIAEALDPLAEDGVIDGFDALASFAPAPATQRARLAVRDALDLPRLGAALKAALAEKGFDPIACAPALESFAHLGSSLEPAQPDPSSSLAWLTARHLRSDETGTLAVTYVRPKGDVADDAQALAAIAKADPDAIVTGYPRLESALRESLAHDLPRVALAALLVVAVALRAILGRTRDVAIALMTLIGEIAGVALCMRVLSVRWHVYDALVLPVLLGVTIDEAMFLLHAAREAEAEGSSPDALVERAFREQGSLVVATALTTAAGFFALLACRFEGLFDLGAVGVLGVLLGLLAALVVVPAGLRVWPVRAKRP